MAQYYSYINDGFEFPVTVTIIIVVLSGGPHERDILANMSHGIGRGRYVTGSKKAWLSARKS